MDDKGLQELEQPETWDYEKAEKRPGVKTPRAVVSVAFARDDFEQVSKYAERLGMRTSEFIRKAALDVAKHQDKSTVQFTGGSLGASVFTSVRTSATRVYSAGLRIEESKLVLTT